MISIPSPAAAIVLVTVIFTSIPGAIAEDGDQVYDKTELLNVRIDLPEEEWDKICRQTRSIVEAFADSPATTAFTWAKARVEINGQVIPEAAIRKKGFVGSLDAQRPSLRLDLNKYDSAVEFDGVDNLTLNNCKQDRSLVSQYLTYENFRKLGLPAPRISFAKVTVNGEDLGIYANVEPVRKKFLRRNFGNAKGKLYEGTVTDFYADSIRRFERKNGDGEKDKRKSLLEVARILDTKPFDMAALSSSIDPDEFLKFWALESLIGFWDGYCSNQNNFFVYHNPEDSRLHFIPWGADVAFARSVIGVMFKRGTPQCANIRGRIPHAMYNDPAMQARYFETLDQLLNEFWNEDELIAETDQVAELLSEHLHESQQDFQKELAAAQSFIKTRRSELAKERANGPPSWAGDAGRPPTATVVGSATGTFSTTWSDKAPDEPGGSAELKVSVDGRDIEFQDLRTSVFMGGNDRGPGAVPNSPKLVISGKTATDERISLTLSISAGFADVSQPLSCQGEFVEGVGGGFFNPPTQRAAAGTVDFAEASREEGQTVKGSFTVGLYKFSSGN